MPHTPPSLLPVALVAVLVAAGIGIGAPAVAADPVVVVFKDGVVTPQTIGLVAGQPAELLLRNEGTSAAEFESRRLKQEQVIAPGAEVRLALPALPAGDYEFVEEFHEDQPGARGVVAVR